MSNSKVLAEARKAATAMKTETAARNAVQRVLAMHGHRGMPKLDTGYDKGGAVVRAYLWEDTPGGDIVLIAGPSIVHEVHDADALRAPKAADEDFAVVMHPGKVTGKAAASLGRASKRARQSEEAEEKRKRQAAARKAAVTRRKQEQAREEAAEKARRAQARQKREAEAATEAAIAKRKRAEAAEKARKAAAAEKRARAERKRKREARAKARKASASEAPAPSDEISDADAIKMLASLMRGES